ncbi:hypothetical protein M8J76_005933 [Diaphorina citri]|nr:hypothetical protein M8J76_005933 [Diaphorina citri]
MSKIIVVTGASVGIGAGILRALAAEGHQVIGLARRAEIIDAMAKENPDWKVHSLKVDVTKDAEVVEAFDWIKNKFGQIDAVINNAGIGILTPVSEAKLDLWREMFELNVFAVGSCMREALKIISDDGNIINVSSVLGEEICSFPGMSVYSSTKHALKVMTKGLRAELLQQRPGIKITLLNPGLVNTPLAATWMGKDKVSFPHYIEPEHVAQAVLYIISTPQFVDVTELKVQNSAEYVR